MTSAAQFLRLLRGVTLMIVLKLKVLLRLQHLLLDKRCAVALRVFCLILEHTAAAAGCVDYNSTRWRPKRLAVHCIQALSRPP